MRTCSWFSIDPSYTTYLPVSAKEPRSMSYHTLAQQRQSVCLAILCILVSRSASSVF